MIKSEPGWRWGGKGGGADGRAICAWKLIKGINLMVLGRKKEEKKLYVVVFLEWQAV